MEAGTEKIEIFFSYARTDRDQNLLSRLKTHLGLLKQQGWITNWYDSNISAGNEWLKEINEHLNKAHIILLLVSPDFIASDYCQSVEVKRAMERDTAGEARVIPVVLRPVDWRGVLFGRLQALPTNVKAVTAWRNQDEAFQQVAAGIRKVVEELRTQRSAILPAPLPHSNSVVVYVAEDIQKAVGELPVKGTEASPSLALQKETAAADIDEGIPKAPGEMNLEGTVPPASSMAPNGYVVIEKRGPTMADHVGQQLGNYRLLRLLGQGSFANVYLGEHIHLGTRAAIKVLRTQLSEEDVKKFGTEAKTIAVLMHPNIVKVLEFGFADQHIPFLVMDFAPYGSLRYPQGTKLPPATIVPYVKQVAAALQYAHDRDVIHRDVKPENMLMGRMNEVLLSDFGIAIVESTRSQRQQDIAGTIAYMAPEQLDGKPCKASDQYGLGVVVYEWLSGRCPFSGSFRTVASQHMFTPPPSLYGKIPEVSSDIGQAVMKALAKKPEERYASVQEFASALEQALLPPLPDQRDRELPPGEGEYVKPLTPNDSMQGVSNMNRDKEDDIPTYPAAIGPSSTPPKEGLLNPKLLQRRSLLVGLGCGFLLGGGVGGFLTRFLFPLTRVQLIAKIVTPTPSPLKLPHIFFGHFSEVNTVAWSPNGKFIASGSRDNTAKIWNVTTGENIFTYTQHNDYVNTVAWSLDGKSIASGSADDTVQVWDAATGGSAITYKGHTASVQVLAWSPDGTSIASGSYDSTVQVWNPTSGHIFVYKGHTAEVDALAWSPDGKLIASGGGKVNTQNTDTTVQVWEATTGHSILIYKGHLAQVDGLAWSPDGRLIASGSFDNTVRVWDIATGGQASTLIYRGHSGPVRAVAWSPGGKLIASASADHTVQVWDASTGNTIFNYRGHYNWVHAVAWSPDGKLIASASADRTIQVWEAKN